MTTQSAGILAEPLPTEHHVPVRPPHHVNSLDGLRALAVLAVMAVHAGVPGSNLGFLGVDIFFVLSGFLITTLLFREHARSGTISVWRFWIRRVLRLMPAYWLYAAVITVLILAGVGQSGPHGGWSVGAFLASLWTYFINYAPLGGIWKHQMLTIHLWSLAVEEQFYFLWPGICWLIFKNRAGSPLPALIAWAMVLCMVAVRHFSPDSQMEHYFPTRGLGIVLGAATALTCATTDRQGIFSSKALRAVIVTATLIALTACTALAVKERIDKNFVLRYALPTLDLLFAALIAMLWYGSPDSLARSLSWKPLAYLGRISYGLYLYHMAAWFLIWGPLLGRRLDHWPKFPKFGLRVSAFFTLTVAIASASYYLLEKPFLKLKDRVR